MLQCVHGALRRRLPLLIPLLYVLSSCLGDVQQTDTHFLHRRKDHRTKTLPPAYELVDPVKVDEYGNFLSYNLTHHENLKRRKRDTRSEKVHYRIRQGTKDLYFNLTVNEGFVSDNYILERRTGNQSGVRITPRSGVSCHFSGTVQQQPDVGFGYAAISACDGLAGFFHLPHGDYFIEPLQNIEATGMHQKHIIYKKEAAHQQRHRRDLHFIGNQSCGVIDDLNSVLQHEHQREKWERMHLKSRKISPRSVSKERWVETLVVADTKMIEYHGSESIESYIFTVMNMVAGLFHDPSIGNAIHIKVVRVILLEEEEEGLKIVHHADQTLASFCKWQKSINPKSDSHPAHHDVAVLLTRKDICAGRNSPCETLGLSHLSGMCQPYRSCNINEDSGLPMAFTIAHEIGHSFGIQHDGQGNDCESTGGQPYIMSRQLQYDTSPLTWSPCSKEYITRFLDRGWGSCLDDLPAKKDFKLPLIAPGVLYGVNHQCQLQYGPNSTFCELVDNVCQTLWCSVKDSCRSKLDATADGTRCGENKWCINGACVTVGKQPDTVNGGWGMWTSWSHCTRTCGAGVQSAERKCNNPEPKFGGKYCTGERKRYRMCKTNPCPKNQLSFRQMQCAEFDTVVYKNELHTWYPIYNTANPCELHCRNAEANFVDKLLDAVIDGTPCFEGNESRDVCINGMCKSVGCDFEINSNATEDRCGICLGDGSSCQTVRKTFDQSDGFGYIDIGVIPKGARAIKIEEVAAAGNFLAIRSEDSEKYYLNGGFIIQWIGDYKVAGTTFHYERSGDLENLTAAGPTNESIWIQLLFQESNPGVKYEYIIQKDVGSDNEVGLVYAWKYGSWSDCSATCGAGVQRQVARCVSRGKGVVKNTFCEPNEQPMPRQKKCNLQDCPARWWTGEWQECSTTCGPTGEKKRTVLCIRTVGSDEQALPSMDCHHLSKPKNYTSCNRDISCPSDWSVSNWTECSVTCGGGIRIRNVTCTKNNNESCDPSKKPYSKALCGLQQCLLQKRTAQLPIKYKNLKTPIKIYHKISDGPKKRFFLLKKKPSFPSPTKAPKESVEITSSFTTASKLPAVNSIEDEFQIYDIPNSTHFNVVHKYNFVLVSSNKKKISANLTKSLPNLKKANESLIIGNESLTTQRDLDLVFNATSSPPNATQFQSVTPSYDFLTQSETRTDTRETAVPTEDPDIHYDAENNNIIESRSKRHKGRVKVPQENHMTATDHPQSSTPVMFTTEISRLLRLGATPESSTENTSYEDIIEQDPELIDLANHDHLPVPGLNISQEPSLDNILNSTESGNFTEPSENQTSGVHWIVGNWSECSTTCGMGAFWRKVECSTGLEADCGHIKKPDPARRCHLRPCAHWKTGNWSKCSTNCGGGYMTREIQCIDIRENRPLRPFHCQSHEHNPLQNTSCNPEPCLSWLAKPWSECSKTCGNGVRQREVFCPKENRCDLKKSPIVILNCSRDPCVRWEASNWTECSASCGEGAQQRSVQCVDTDNNRTVNSSFCEKEPKPQEGIVCNIKECSKIPDAPCKKDKLSINFCNTVKSIGKCTLKSIQSQCCFTCGSSEDVLHGG
ncbi:A disintegrin and metalloproteinase with thrombospondin motifs 12 isoform X1 [Hyla sarda]|uniref:A disintegrin and metalloproteinase with thrombospondin motifs 12 isoform X1 n=1 Tax=Hyla sarda TaxID=327740 RepID=UPI0024C2AB18|nr:A disintegrin and metalloproteinase with thrombospondin motifs 12 isoform X1 [Hyla sarda]